MKLTDAKLRGLKEPGKHFDGGGLYLELTAAGGRYWRMKYRFAGKEKRLAFGVYPEVSLKEARERRDEARKRLSNDEDPGALRQAAKVQAVEDAANTFKAVAADWLAHNRPKWKTNTHAAIEAAFKAHAYPKIGARPLAHMKPGEVIAVVKAIEAAGAGEAASRMLQRIRAVFRFAITHERIGSNPMLDLKAGELLKPRQVKHRPALSDADLPAFLAGLDAYRGDPTTVNALRLLMLTAVRPGELRGARWAEFDLQAAVWRIPAERMKMKTEHLVPLSRQALAILDDQSRIAGGDGLVFPSPFYPTQALSENTFNSMMARLGYKGSATAHGFRALFSTVANECGHDPDAIERQLAHKERNEVRAAYHRATYTQARAELMQWWADYLDGRKGGKVIGFGRTAARRRAG